MPRMLLCRSCQQNSLSRVTLFLSHGGPNEVLFFPHDTSCPCWGTRRHSGMHYRLHFKAESIQYISHLSRSFGLQPSLMLVVPVNCLESEQERLKLPYFNLRGDWKCGHFQKLWTDTLKEELQYALFILKQQGHLLCVLLVPVHSVNNAHSTGSCKGFRHYASEVKKMELCEGWADGRVIWQWIGVSALSGTTLERCAFSLVCTKTNCCWRLLRVNQITMWNNLSCKMYSENSCLSYPNDKL